MSKKDFDNYVRQIDSQYSEMLETVKEIEEAVKEKIMAPEQLEQVKNSMLSIKTEWQNVHWHKFLMDKPAHESKNKKYCIKNMNVLRKKAGTRTSEVVLEKNQKELETLSNINSELSK